MRKKLFSCVKPSLFTAKLIFEMMALAGAIFPVIAVMLFGAAKPLIFIFPVLFKMMAGAGASFFKVLPAISFVMMLARTVRAAERPERF